MIRAMAAVGVAWVLPLVLVIALAGALAGSQNQTQAVAATCAGWDGDTPPTLDLDAGQVDSAATIYSVALDTDVGTAGAIVGIATAMTESTLGANPAAATPNEDGDVGLFQQRSLVGWYADGATQAENVRVLSDDRYQARNFFTGHTTLDGWHIPGLRDIQDWQQMTVTQAAQAVQVSAFPDAYARYEALARTLVSLFSGNPGGLANCGTLTPDLDCPATGLQAEQGLTSDALRVLRCIRANWSKISTLYGLRTGDPRDHGTGRAIDAMIPGHTTEAGIALGDEIAEWAQTNAAGLGVTYIIWRKHLWSVERADEGWRRCGTTASCYSGDDPSAAHLDHVHISVHGDQGTGLPEALDTGMVVLPLENYVISATFGDSGARWTASHTGLDFAASTGTPIQAVTDATITSITHTGPYGNLTQATSNDGTIIYYAHQSLINVTVGQRVTAGTVIGSVGATGNVTGPHLHLEIRINGAPVDPQQWLATRGLVP